MTDSQDWWPADFGHYGGLFIRMSWHAAGTYRIEDGRGGAGDGAQRFAPLNSWPDNANLDKARRLLWPVKQKYGQKISWADLLVLAGNVALESMGFETFGFGFGREDIWEPEEIFWGPEDTWLGDERYSGDRELARPLGAVQMGLIYVNPEGPNGDPDPLAAARDIRETFRPDGDERRGDGRPDRRRPHVRQDPRCRPGRPRRPGARGRPLEGRASAGTTPTAPARAPTRSPAASRCTWTTTPTRGATASSTTSSATSGSSPRARPAPSSGWPRTPRRPSPTPDEPRSARPTMLTTDLALRVDPAYEQISRRFLENHEEFRLAFAKAWYKLLHRDMGPVSRYLGPWVRRAAAVAGPGPGRRPRAGRRRRRRGAEGQAARLRPVRRPAGPTAWASAASFRGTDKRGGANGARIRLEPQRNWEVNEADQLAKVLQTLERHPAGVQRGGAGGKQISLADLIVLGGAAAVEKAARNAGQEVTVPFRPGRTDASQEETDVDSFAVLEPRADGFRNYLRAGEKLPPETLLLDRAYMLGLTAPEMTVLVGGLRALGANAAARRTASSPTGRAR